MCTTEKFIEMFKEVKAEKKGRKSILKGLNARDEKKLKAITRRGYTVEEIAGAVRAMFDDPEQWAVKTENDIPTHFLNQFDRYIELSTAEKKEEAEKKEKILKPLIDWDLEQKKQQIEWLNLSKLEYSKALKLGVWKGSLIDASRIGKLFAESITREVKDELYKEAIAESKDIQERETGDTRAEQILKENSTPYNLFCEKVIKKAIELKVVEPWKK